MTHANSRFSIASVSVFSVGVAAAVCMLGCAADVTGDVSSTTEALYPNNLRINYTDSRESTFFQVGISAVDQSNGGFYGGNVTIPGSMVSGNFRADHMYWSQDGLSLAGSEPNPTEIIISDQSTAPHRFTKMRVSVLATINGGCHTDWEDVDLSHFVQLYFSGQGGSFNGSCWVGNLLHP